MLARTFACHSPPPFWPYFIVFYAPSSFIVVIEVIEVYICEFENRETYNWMAASQTFNKYLNGSVPITQCYAVSPSSPPSPPLRPLALMADGTGCLLARTIHISLFVQVLSLPLLSRVERAWTIDFSCKFLFSTLNGLKRDEPWN